MIDAITIIALGIFIAGIAVGVIAVVTLGIRREERQFREAQRLREERFFQTGEIHPGYIPVEAPDHLTSGARRLTGLWVHREPTIVDQAPNQDLPIQ